MPHSSWLYSHFWVTQEGHTPLPGTFWSFQKQKQIAQFLFTIFRIFYPQVLGANYRLCWLPSHAWSLTEASFDGGGVERVYWSTSRAASMAICIRPTLVPHL